VAELAVELPRAVHRADDRVQRDDLRAEPALAGAPERVDHLLEREDDVDIAGLAPQPAHDARHRPAPARAQEVVLDVGADEAGANHALALGSRVGGDRG
jgi:hypothetical protein